ncbi:hypothetical protein [Endozoicomonas sp.]|uniref:hypothetical protein n=1 Tax=Endozoicomonas sp. TaxID=1892382 RepID=UPI0028836B14|nr:hypothetical protein [Endozoicomonas sp.]
MILSVGRCQQVSGHSSSVNLASASENCLQKYIPTSTDRSVDVKELTKRALSALTEGEVKAIQVPENCCLGVSVEWIVSFLESSDCIFSCQKARSLHKEYWSNIKASDRLDTLNNKKKDCVELTYQFLSSKMHDKEINIDVEPYSFNHVKSLVSTLSQAFFLLPKCCVLLILQGQGRKTAFQGHNFIISWSVQDHNKFMTLFDPSGTQITWKRNKGETPSKFFIRVMDNISDIIGLFIKGDGYSFEEIKSILLYKGKSLKYITGVD